MTEDRIAIALEKALEIRAGRGDEITSIELTPEEQVELNSLLEVADLVWSAGPKAVPPQLANDPTSIMLGLVQNQN